MKNETKTPNPLLITVVVAAVIGAISFFGGMKYQQSQAKTPFGFQNAGGRTAMGNGNGTFMMTRGGNGNNRPVAGEIISADDQSITVKMEDGSSKIVLINESTSINKAEAGTKAELTSGTKVAVFGTTNSDGSVTALSVQLNPQTRLFGGQGSPAATPSQ